MKIKKLEIESDILEKNVYQVEQLGDAASFANEESSIIQKHQPFYLQCEVDAGDLATIHEMEAAGFRFVEFRLRKQLDAHTFRSVDQLAYFPYVIKSVRDEKSYEKALQILEQSQPDDRFSRDPLISKDISMKRLQWYLKKSFENKEREFVWGLFNKNTTELLGFKTIELNKKNQVLFEQTAIKQDLDNQKFTFMLDALVISHYFGEGINYFFSVTSAFNLMEVDLHISDLKYKNISSSLILRKIYE